MSTKMQVLKWKVKRLVSVIVLGILLYFWLRPREFTYKEEIRMANTQPSEVWEYVADFSNMMNLNPTIVDFTVLSESGNYDHWQYTTRYKEHLSHWPYLQNIATARFSVHSNFKNNHYFINSTHTTCFFTGMICLNSNSEFKFSLLKNINVRAAPHTLCEETVNYQCPPLLYLFCKREVVYQRHAIMNNLQVQFAQKKT
ncbi:uncharacterized protein CBL_14647 [Carabus blaptoides fortunei]